MNNFEKYNITPQLLAQWIQEEKDGNTELTHRIGFAFLSGDGGIQPNVPLGLKYIDKAAVECNDIEAQYMLGLFYENGNYTVKDEEKSISYYTMAAANNHAESQYALSCLLLKGSHKSPKWLYWMCKSHLNGFSSATEYLENMIANDGDIAKRTIEHQLEAISVSE